jgi:hypothetical protein
VGSATGSTAHCPRRRPRVSSAIAEVARIAAIAAIPSLIFGLVPWIREGGGKLRAASNQVLLMVSQSDAKDLPTSEGSSVIAKGVQTPTVIVAGNAILPCHPVPSHARNLAQNSVHYNSCAAQRERLLAVTPLFRTLRRAHQRWSRLCHQCPSRRFPPPPPRTR